MNALSIRPARPDDLDRVLAIHVSAYPDERTAEVRARYLSAPPLGEPGDLWVAERDGIVVGHAFLFALRAWFGGRTVSVGGVASVGVAPEARGCGIASRLMDHLHQVARERGDVVTVLYPFREGFYRRFGYGATSAVRHVRFAPGALANLTRDLSVEEATAADRTPMVECRDRFALSRGTGLLVRSERAWQALLSADRRVWLVARGGPGLEGYASWTVHQPDPYGPTTLAVHELVAPTDAAWRSLWSAVGSQRDQVDEVHADVAEDDPIDRALVDGDRGRRGDAWVPHGVGSLANGPLIRIVDIAPALAARGWPVGGRLGLEVEGARLALEVSAGRATVTASEAPADLTLDRAALASIAFGGVGVERALRLGWVAARDPSAAAQASAMFGGPPYFSSDPF